MSRLLATWLVAAIATASVTACTDVYEFEPASAGDEEGTGREPRARTSSQFLRTLFADLLGRAPQAYELEIRFGADTLRVPVDEERELSTVLDGLGDSLPMRNLIVKGLLHSVEVSLPDKASAAAADGGDPRPYIRGQFETLLGRSPNAYELETFAAAWAQEPAVGPRTIIRAILGSREYQSQ